MAKKLLKGLIILVFGLAVCSWSRAVTEETEESLSLLLPRSAEVPGWERHDDFQDYKYPIPL